MASWGGGSVADDWKFAAEQFVRRMPDKVIIHRSQCNSATQTFDGVDLMGERLANEVLSVVEQRRGVKMISIVAHSLGGLVARYAIGRLYECGNRTKCSVGNNREQVECLEGLIAGLKPMNFITFASPHLGSSGNKQLPFLCGLPFLERRASETAHLIVGRTGKHLFLTDSDDGRRPLLLQMVQDHDDIKFRSGLRSFKRRVAYANANFDHMVGWRTSSIRRQHELPKHRLLVRDEKYPHIVHVDRGIMERNETEVSANLCGPEEEMIRGLTQLQWERVDVSFQKSSQRLVAHNTIQRYLVQETTKGFSPDDHIARMTRTAQL
ncbi:lipid droplet phospholipase 1-like isoform X6 [Triticum dicoccoides]|uniref:lipid droplet phospholipase 1-like isoform X6 n=1 Tax=Triticum dicoccoides TaxID=85692 RepID=UPI001891ED80|nr:lipid droplet phospholipase 1-like isoform X6 [Triticum dicoccoides]